MDISRIVNLAITMNTLSASLASFNSILIAAPFLKATPTTPYGTSERVRSYASLAAVSADFGTSGSIYLMAQQIFAQSPSVNIVYIGRKLTGGDGSETWTAALTAMNLYNPAWYAVVTNDRALAQQELIAAWVESNTKLYLADSADPNIINGTGDIATYFQTQAYKRSLAFYQSHCKYQDTVQAVFGSPNPGFVTSNSIVATINGSALGAVVFNTDSATTYGLLKTAIAAVYTGADIQYNATASPVANPSTVAGSLAAVPTIPAYGLIMYQQGMQFIWSFVISSGATQATITLSSPNDANDQYPAAAWLGAIMPYAPGVANWAYLNLAGVSADVLTTTQIETVCGSVPLAVTGKNGNVYTAVSGVAITQFGQTGSGQYADITQGIDWLTAVIQTDQLNLLINVKGSKVPYTDIGIQQVAGILQGSLGKAVAAGIIINPSVVYPTAANISSATKQTRNLAGVSFTAKLVGAIDSMNINGYFSY